MTTAKVALALAAEKKYMGYSKINEEVRYRPTINVSPMSPKLFLSYPHREEYREINLATLFL